MNPLPPAMTQVSTPTLTVSRASARHGAAAMRKALAAMIGRFMFFPYPAKAAC